MEKKLVPVGVVARTVTFEIDENTTGETLKQEFLKKIEQGVEFDFCIGGEILYTTWGNNKLDKDFEIYEPLEKYEIDDETLATIEEWSERIYKENNKEM